MTLRQIPSTLIEHLGQLLTALEARRSTTDQRRVGSDMHNPVQPYKAQNETPLQAQPSHDAPTSIQLQHNHNASTAFAPARRAACQQTNTYLTIPQHYPATLRQPSSSHQALRHDGQCLQPRKASGQRTCQTIYRYSLVNYAKLPMTFH